MRSKVLLELFVLIYLYIVGGSVFINSPLVEYYSHSAELDQAFKLCQLVPGLGPQISIFLLITTRTFKAFKNARQFACYSGIAPFEYSSGSSIKGRSRVSHLANKKGSLC